MKMDPKDIGTRAQVSYAQNTVLYDLHDYVTIFVTFALYFLTVLIILMRCRCNYILYKRTVGSSGHVMQ